MLKNFFSLNKPFKVFQTPKELLDHFELSTDLRNVLYEPDELAPTRPQNRFKDYTFENVSFAKTTIRGIEFRNCHFNDCLFIGTIFVNCEFHRCSFSGCNTHKIIFDNIYIDPQVFVGMLDPSNYANIGIHLFHQLYSNSNKMNQREFSNTAEFNFMKWKRYLLFHEWIQGEIGFRTFIKKWVPNIFYYYVAGYGLRAKFFAIWTIVMLFGVSWINYRFWSVLNIVGKEGLTAKNGVIEAFYFSIVTMSTLGYGDLTPNSELGMIIIGFEALLGIVWLSVFASTVIKRVTR